jgi:hypothetical protein
MKKFLPKEHYEQIVFRNIEEAQGIGIYLNGVLDCIDSAFEGGVTREDALHHISGDLVTVVVDSEESVKGFSSTLFGSPKNILGTGSEEIGCYLQGATVSKEAWGNGVYKQMNELRIREGIDAKLPLVFTRTQNPRVEKGILAVLEKFKKQNIIKDFQLNRIFVEGCYGTMLTKDEPILDSTDTGEAFKKLNFRAGDAYVLTFELEY